MVKIQRVEWTRLGRPSPAEANRTPHSAADRRFAVRVVADARIQAGTELAVHIRAQNGRLTPALVRVVSGRQLGDQDHHHICQIVKEKR